MLSLGCGDVYHPVKASILPRQVHHVEQLIQGVSGRRVMPDARPAGEDAKRPHAFSSASGFGAIQAAKRIEIS